MKTKADGWKFWVLGAIGEGLVIFVVVASMCIAVRLLFDWMR